MSRLILLAAGAHAPASASGGNGANACAAPQEAGTTAHTPQATQADYSLPQGWHAAGANDVVAHWDRLAVPEGHVSIPALLEANLIPIRRELMAWTWELGRASIAGRELRDHLRGGDTLSLWTCSTLAEKHPKVTRNLYPALKLRALEMLAETHRVTTVEVITADQLLVESLKRFCTATGRSFTPVLPEGTTPPAETPLLSVRGLYQRMPAVMKAAVRLGAWLVRERRLLPFDGSPLPPHADPATVVTYFPNVDMKAAKEGRLRSRYWESLHDALTPRSADRAHATHNAAGEQTNPAMQVATATEATEASQSSPPTGNRPALPGVHWLFLFEPTPHFSLREAIAFRNELAARKQDGVSFRFIEEFLRNGDIVTAVKSYLSIAVAGVRLEGEVQKHFRLPGSRMDLWPMLGCNWADSTRGWIALDRCLKRLAFRRYAERCAPQRWTIFPMENCPWEKMVAHAMHEHNRGPVYGTQHSTVRPADFRYFDDPRTFSDPQGCMAAPDSYHCNGTGAREHMLAAGVPAERVGIIEALRYLYLAPEGSGETAAPAKPATVAVVNEASPPASASQGNAATAHGAPTGGKPRLVVMASFFADETDAQLATLAQAAHTGVLTGYDVVVKPHPNLPVQGRLAALFPQGGAPEVVNTPVPELLVPGTVVWAANSTTVALEAAYKGLPLVVQAAVDDFDMCPLAGVPGVVFVRDAADLGAALTAPRTPDLAPGFLALDRALPRWRALLGL